MRPLEKKRRLGTTRNPLGGPPSKEDCYNCLARFASLRKRLVGASDYVGADCLRVFAREFRGEGDHPILAELAVEDDGEIADGNVERRAKNFCRFNRGQAFQNRYGG